MPATRSRPPSSPSCPASSTWRRGSSAIPTRRRTAPRRRSSGRGAGGTSSATGRPCRPGCDAASSTGSSTAPGCTTTSWTSRPSRPTGTTIDWSVVPELVLERAEMRDELEDALARLPVVYRVAVVLHDAIGWTAPEIAAATSARAAGHEATPAKGSDDARERARRRRRTSSCLRGAAAALLAGPPPHLGLPRRRAGRARRRRPSRSTSPGARPVRRSTPAWSASVRRWVGYGTRTPSWRPTLPAASGVSSRSSTGERPANAERE